jgi:phospholipase/carboxylesterase
MSLTSYHHLSKAPAEGAPLVFAFHGTGGDERQFYGVVEQFLPQAGIVAPRGDVSEHGANRFFRRIGEGVYDMSDLAARTEKMTAFIRAHKDTHPGIPVFGLGYSNGANILSSVLFDTAGLFDRVVLMHPLIPLTPAANPNLAGLDVLITAGRYDPSCPLPRTEALERYFRTQGASVVLNLQEGGHDVRQTELDAIEAFLKR